MRKDIFKSLFLRLLPLLPLFIFMNASCEKEDLPPLEQLPPATQEGKDTFGCLVNGKAFVPRGWAGFGVPPYQCYYQLLTEDYNPVKGYFFKVSAGDYTNEDQVMSVTVGTRSLQLREGGVYPLTERGVVGSAFGDYWKSGLLSSEEYTVKAPLAGELRITKLDEARQIVSGTFWFDAINGLGEKVEVREGRFDMGYHR
ncbi:MAG: hypothetical protein ACO1OQ_13195 [Rufibacter sp.]